MGILYRVYSNNGTGGPIDYGTPVGVVAESVFETGELQVPSDNLFGIRSFDASSQLEEANTDVRIRIVIDSEGRDITSRPNAPHALVARPTSPGTWMVRWAYDRTAQYAEPREFQLLLRAGSLVEAPVLSARIPYHRSSSVYQFLLSELIDHTNYWVSVSSCGGQDFLMSDAKVVTFENSNAVPALIEQLTVSLR